MSENNGVYKRRFVREKVVLDNKEQNRFFEELMKKYNIPIDNGTEAAYINLSENIHNLGKKYRNNVMRERILYLINSRYKLQVEKSVVECSLVYYRYKYGLAVNELTYVNKTTKENLEDIDWVEEQVYYKDDEHFNLR